MNTKLQDIDHIHIFVENRQKALDWYKNILGLKPLEKLISLPNLLCRSTMEGKI